MIINLPITPKFIESSRTEIKVQVHVELDVDDITDNIALPKLAYIEVYTVPSKNISTGVSRTVRTLKDTLQRPIITSTASNTTGNATFQLGYSLHNLFEGYTVPNTTDRIQKDESSYIGYFLKYGYITYNTQNEQVKNYIGQTAVCFVLRSAFNDNEISTYVPDFVTSATGKALTNIPNNYSVHLNEDVFVTVLIPKNVDDILDEKAVFLKADLYFKDGTSVLNRTIQSFAHHSGGNYIFNFRPALNMVGTNKNPAQLSKMAVWLDYLTGGDSGSPIGSVPNYSATASYTATCGTGFIGSAVTSTKTATSEISTADAQQIAYDAALAEATAALVCTARPSFTGTATYTASCAAGMTGSSVTRTGSYVGYISQADSNTQALAIATADANRSLVCVPAVPFSVYAEYTATCPAGTGGADVTRGETRSSFISYADAQALAEAAAQASAEAALVCVAEYWYCDLGGNGGADCFRGGMISNLGNTRGCTQQEGQGCWTDYSGYGEYCGLNPY